jgi:hypothetical protein
MFPPTSNGGHRVMRWMPALAGNVPRRGLIRWAGEVLGHRTSRGSRGRTLPGGDGRAGYVVRPVPRNRQVVLDALTGAARRFPVHGLVEFDVRQASSRLAESQPPVSWTGFAIATMARAVALHPEVSAKNAKFLTRGMLWPAVGANAPMG